MSEWQPIEIWRPVVGRENQYQVSSFGRIKTCIGRILGQWQSDQGYLVVRFSRPRRVVKVHRVVAEAFIPNPEQKPSVNHIDCVRSNNVSKNLEWCTQIENLRHSENLGRMQRNYWIGRRSPSASLSDDTVREMRVLYATGKYSWETIGEKFGVSKRCAGRAIKRETYADVQ